MSKVTQTTPSPSLRPPSSHRVGRGPSASLHKRTSRPGQAARRDARARLKARYDRFWSETIGRIRAGRVERDPVLESRLPDQRRGLTLIARPSATVRQSVVSFLRELQELEPDQYFYTATELHMTVLSLFTAMVEHGPFFARIKQYLAALDDALRGVAPFRIEFEGVTTSAGTVMIQGFFEDGALNDLRDALRSQLRLCGLGGGVDERYRLESAHMTVVRFRAPLRDSERFARALEAARRRSFGATVVRNLSLVKSDWYMSRRTTETIKRYRL